VSEIEVKPEAELGPSQKIVQDFHVGDVVYLKGQSTAGRSRRNMTIIGVSPVQTARCAYWCDFDLRFEVLPLAALRLFHRYE
jgi:hypothetical protein